jgi:copper(I)-binding protein
VPNSYHLLITGAGPMHDGKDITLTLKFAHAGTITILALVTNPNNGGGSYFLN